MTTQHSPVADPETAVYTAQVEVTGGRAGRATSRTGQLELALARPAQRGKGQGTDPEELFAAGYAACFDSALNGAARREGLDVGTTTTTAAVTLHVSADQQYSISVQLEVTSPDCSTQVLEQAVAFADQMCPYSKALRGNVPVGFTVRGRG